MATAHLLAPGWGRLRPRAAVVPSRRTGATVPAVAESSPGRRPPGPRPPPVNHGERRCHCFRWLRKSALPSFRFPKRNALAGAGATRRPGGSAALHPRPRAAKELGLRPRRSGDSRFLRPSPSGARVAEAAAPVQARCALRPGQTPPPLLRGRHEGEVRAEAGSGVGGTGLVTRRGVGDWTLSSVRHRIGFSGHGRKNFPVMTGKTPYLGNSAPFPGQATRLFRS